MFLARNVSAAGLKQLTIIEEMKFLTAFPNSLQDEGEGVENLGVTSTCVQHLPDDGKEWDVRDHDSSVDCCSLGVAGK